MFLLHEKFIYLTLSINFLECLETNFSKGTEKSKINKKCQKLKLLDVQV